MSIHKVLNAAELGIDLVGPMRSANRGGELFGREDFNLDWEARTHPDRPRGGSIGPISGADS